MLHIITRYPSCTVEVLGTGMSCRVLLAHHRVSKKRFAVKEMIKSDENLESFLHERELLRKLSEYPRGVSVHCLLVSWYFRVGNAMLSTP